MAEVIRQMGVRLVRRALLASMAEHTDDAERGDRLLDCVMTIPPLADRPSDSLEALRETIHPEHRSLVSAANSDNSLEETENHMRSEKENRHNSNVATSSVVIAEETLAPDKALERLERYPSRTPAIYDYPGPGEPSVITADEIRRTRAVSSRISAVQSDWFVKLARTAPWTPADGDLRDADPGESGGLYDSMIDLYDHFAAAAPKGVNMTKISKVLHLKRPRQFPILDSRLVRIYKEAAAREAATYTSRGNSRMYWTAVRSDLERSADGLTDLRSRLAAHPAARVQDLQAVSDLRLHDILTW